MLKLKCCFFQSNIIIEILKYPKIHFNHAIPKSLRSQGVTVTYNSNGVLFENLCEPRGEKTIQNFT